MKNYCSSMCIVLILLIPSSYIWAQASVLDDFESDKLAGWKTGNAKYSSVMLIEKDVISGKKSLSWEIVQADNNEGWVDLRKHFSQQDWNDYQFIEFTVKRIDEGDLDKTFIGFDFFNDGKRVGKGNGVYSISLVEISHANKIVRVPINQYERTHVDSIYFFVKRSAFNNSGANIIVDDFRLTGSSDEISCSKVVVNKGVPKNSGVYPLLDNIKYAPAVEIVSDKDAGFGFSAKLASNKSGLNINIAVVDPTDGGIFETDQMWRRDSVQLAIDTRPGQVKKTFDENCYELGFALMKNGTVCVREFMSLLNFLEGKPNTNVDLSLIQANGHRVPGGYQIDVSVPWEFFNNKTSYEDVLGINILVNDGQKEGQSGGVRRYVEWTRGIGEKKMPQYYTRFKPLDLHLHGSVVDVHMPVELFDTDDYLNVVVTEVSQKDFLSSELELSVVRLNGRIEKTNIPKFVWPLLEKKSTASCRILLPESIFSDEGKYLLEAVIKDGASAKNRIGKAYFTKKNSKKLIGDAINKTSQKISEYSEILESNSLFKDDYNLCLAINVLNHFKNRLLLPSLSELQKQSWSIMQADEMMKVVARTDQYIQKQLENGALPGVHRDVRVNTGVVWGNNGIHVSQQTGAENKYKYPVFLNGYGHFSKAGRDVGSFPQFGMNIIQQDRGPNSMGPDGKLHSNMQKFIGVLKDAKSNGVLVDVLLSPHYFPQWAKKLIVDYKCANPIVFIDYDIDHPSVRKVLSDWIKNAVSYLGKEKSISSICLANEPAYASSGISKYSNGAWVQYLESIYGSISYLNQLYCTDYLSFSDVPVFYASSTQQRVAVMQDIHKARMLYDWVRFNQKNFTDFIFWLNEQVKLQSPTLPTHVKIMSRSLDYDRIYEGCDPELITEITDIAGNDSGAYLIDDSDFVYDWSKQLIWYDLLRSFGNKQVFNSENHLIPDRYPAKTYPSDVIYTLLWNGAVHGCSASVIWLWDEITHPDKEGCIYFRPDNIYMAGKANLDLNRLAEKVYSFANAEPDMLFLYSPESLYWNENYCHEMKNVYEALSMQGYKISFVSERMLKKGLGIRCGNILIPDVTHISEPFRTMLQELAANGTRFIVVGSNSMSKNEYSELYSDDFRFSKVVYIPEKLPIRKLHSYVASAFADEGLKLYEGDDVAFGVVYNVVNYDGGTLVAISNMTKTEKVLSMRLDATGKDLISGDNITLNEINLKPLKPLLVDIKR